MQAFQADCTPVFCCAVHQVSPSCRSQGDRWCSTVTSVQNLFSLLFWFSSTAPCYLLVFFCYSMGRLWAVAPQECPAMSYSLTVFPQAALSHQGLPAILQEHILFNTGYSFKTASLAMSTKTTFSLFFSATSFSPSMYPHDYHFSLNVCEAGCQDPTFSFGSQWDAGAGMKDFGEVCEMIFFFKQPQYFKFRMCIFCKSINLKRDI